MHETFLLSLDDLLAVTREFIHPEVSRSGLDRCLRRHGVSNLKALMPQEDGAKMPVKPFKAYDPGFVHVGVKYLPQMPDEDHRQYLFAAIDRANPLGLRRTPPGQVSRLCRRFPHAPDRQDPLHDHQGPHR